MAGLGRWCLSDSAERGTPQHGSLRIGRMPVRWRSRGSGTWRTIRMARSATLAAARHRYGHGHSRLPGRLALWPQGRAADPSPDAGSVLRTSVRRRDPVALSGGLFLLYGIAPGWLGLRRY